MLLDRRSSVGSAPGSLTSRESFHRLDLIALTVVAIAVAGCNGSGTRGTASPVTAAPVATTAATPVATAAVAATPAAPGVAPAAAAQAAMSGPYLIGPQDVLEITVFEVAELNRTVQVSGSGTVNFPLIGDVPAMGRSARELEADIAKRLDNGYVRSPNVSVNVKEFNSQRVTVDGSVRKPGVFPVRDRLTLTQAIALAGGQDTETAGPGVTIARNTASGQSILRFDINAIRRGTVPDPVLMNGDVLVVEASNGKAVLNVIGKIAPVGGLVRMVP